MNEVTKGLNLKWEIGEDDFWKQVLDRKDKRTNPWSFGGRGVKMNTVSEKRLNKLEHKLDIQGRCQV